MTSLLVLTEGDSSIGLGHVRRCMTLAAALQREGVLCEFALRGGEAADLVRGQGFQATVVRDFSVIGRATGADALLVDSYRIEPELFAVDKPIAVVDDLADRELPVDVILNPGAAAASLRYRGRPDTVLLLGPRYALLRPEFGSDPKRETAETIRRVMVTLGGSDHGRLACDLAEWVLEIVPEATVDMVVGPFFRSVAELQSLARAKRQLRLVVNPPDMRDLMLQCDVAVSSGGQTLYELAATGTPALAVSTADNQKYNIEGLAAEGAILPVERPSREHLARAFGRILPAAVRAEMSRRGRALVDGRGADRAAERIAEVFAATRRMDA